MVKLICSGRIVLGVESETLRCIAMSRPEREVLLEMSCVRGLDAAGLGLLVELHQSAQNRAARLVIANPSERSRELIRLTNLDQVLTLARVEGEPAECDSEEWRILTA